MNSTKPTVAVKASAAAWRLSSDHPSAGSSGRPNARAVSTRGQGRYSGVGSPRAHQHQSAVEPDCGEQDHGGADQPSAEHEVQRGNDGRAPPG